VKLTGIIRATTTWKWVQKKRTAAKGTVGDVKKLEMSSSEMIQNKDEFYFGILGIFLSYYFLIFHLYLDLQLKIFTRQQYHFCYFFFRPEFVQCCKICSM